MTTATVDAALKQEKKDLVICDALTLRESLQVINKLGFVLLRTTGNANIFIPSDVDVISRFSVNAREEFIFLKKASFTDLSEIKFNSIEDTF